MPRLFRPKLMRVGVAAAFALSAANQVSQQTPKQEVLIHVTVPSFSPDLPSATRDNLRERLLAFDRIARKRGLLGPRDALSVVAYGLQSGKELASINATTMRKSASLIKPFVAYAAYHKIASGHPGYAGIEGDINASLSLSDNNATNRLIDFVGGPKAVTRFLRAKGYSGTQVNEKIPVDYPNAGRTYYNSTTAFDLARLLINIHTGNAINKKYSKRLLSNLGGYTSLFSPQARALKVRLIGKNGSVKGLNGESWLSYPQPGSKVPPYLGVLMIETSHLDPRFKKDPKGREWYAKTSGVLQGAFGVMNEGMVARGIYPKYKTAAMRKGGRKALPPH